MLCQINLLTIENSWYQEYVENALIHFLERRKNMDQKDKDNLLQMIADHNAECKEEKTFYYSEEEVRKLCREAIIGDIPCSPEEVFNTWWNNVKKK